MEPDPPTPAAHTASTPEADAERAATDGLPVDKAGRLVHIESADVFRTLLDSAGGSPPSAGTVLPFAWTWSSYSRDKAERLVVAHLSDGSALLSCAGNGRTIHVPRHEWYAFLDGVKDGEFDGPVVLPPDLPDRTDSGEANGTLGGGTLDGRPE